MSTHLMEGAVVDYHHDTLGSKIGMWLFLFTEVLLFGGMFIAFSVYLFQYAEDFRAGSNTLNVVIGAVNTVILLTSSLTVVLGITALQREKRGLAIFFIVLTVALAGSFLVNKYFEWTTKIHHGIYPNAPDVLAMPHGKTVFYGLYYMMTGIHALHVLVGMLVLLVVAFLIGRGRITAADITILENSGLYWHLVDLIWIFLFPLFYLIR